ncbi:phosphatidylinositol mannoside acyltransferase [Actinokineospora auranticolor]|uniref:KDO2-lipid IV(A) lauroyltransferase n=1 Tax=Actinokineospora auranticolor TaxID=155976 RepID=A0A2S6GQ65_9PSEU|nr:phosphatidylinositol mannoside acyltransferase [Actinokineospora auranticolor]PPK67368.1 KDO2-lipid IV(A) lauroyltransferase [Actinokineospora auranticolor]
MNWGERLQTGGYGLGWKLVRALPHGTAAGLFRAGADLAARREGAGSRQLRANLARVVPQAGPAELDDLVRQALRSYARYWMEAFRLPSMDHADIHRRIGATMTGNEYVTAALAEGNGVVLALGHSGNWDAAGVWLVGEHGRFTTVAERLRPEALYEKFVAYRESLGFEIVPATGGDKNPAVVLAERLRQNGLVCLLADRDLTPAGLPVNFFGEQTRMPAGPAYLAARTGAALLPVGTWYTDDGWGLRIHPPVKVDGVRGIPAATQALADTLAADIAAHPADWHMLQKLWLADLPADRRAALTDGAPRGRR